MEKASFSFPVVWFSVWMAFAATQPCQADGSSAIPYVPTRHDTVKDLLWLAEVGTNDVVYDLGSGDGRIVIAAVRDFGARRAVGVEADPQLVQQSREKAAQAGVADRVQFIQGDLFTNDVSPASVVVLYLGHAANIELRARLVRSLKPGARIVSHQFSMGEWAPDKRLDVRTVFLGMYSTRIVGFENNQEVPDFQGHESGKDHDVLSAWIVPAPVAGTWRGKVRVGSEERELQLTLHQRLSALTGSFVFHGPTNLQGYVHADLWGDHLRCWCIATNQGWYWSQMWFDGHAKSNTLNGSLWVTKGSDTKEYKWEAQRELADLTGTWEWPGVSNSPVQLKIERRDGRLAATYTDKSPATIYNPSRGQPISVTDFHDCGGGLYFTLLLGQDENDPVHGGRRIGPEDGWVAGEAVSQDGTLRGTIAFYPYDNPLLRVGLPGHAQAKSVAAPSRLDWRPRRVSQ